MATRPIKAGEQLSGDNLTTKRPAIGIGAQHWDRVVGRYARRDIAADSALNDQDVEPLLDSPSEHRPGSS